MSEIDRHPNNRASVDFQFGLPTEGQHIIATHLKGGDLSMRTVDSFIVHHVDFASNKQLKV